jgi:NADH-quinone oxidoreductase subunit A
MIDYVPIGLQLAAAAILAVVMLGVSTLLGRASGSRTDLSPYECGVDPLEPSGKRYNVRFYMVGMLFILFDIEAAFLYPWATVFRDLGLRAFFEMAVFIGVLIVGFLYCWRRGALDWD